MKRGKVAVMGSFVVDLMMRAERLPLPGETIKGSGFFIGAGGKGSNQGVAAIKTGSETVMITKIGEDNFSSVALDSFKSFGMSTEYVIRDPKYSTGAALIMVDENTSQNKIIVTLGASNHIDIQDIERARKEIESADILLTQLETNQDAVLYAIDIAYNAGVPIILNPAPAEFFPEEYYHKIDFFTPNETEAAYLSGIEINTIEDAEKAAKHFLHKGVKNCIFTLGGKGSFLMNKVTSGIFPPFKVKVLDTTGAGDAFNGGLATALAEKKSIEEAIKFANAVAALSVTKMGTAKSMPSREEVEEFLKLQITN